jgi:hypothetical protein
VLRDKEKVVGVFVHFSCCRFREALLELCIRVDLSAYNTVDLWNRW